MALVHELGYLPDAVYERMTIYAESIGKQLNNYIAYLKCSKQGEKELPAGYTIHETPNLYLLDNLEENP